MTDPFDPAKIMVVIPTLNEEKHIETCLSSLMDADPEMQEVSVIVADGGSSDATRDLVAQCAATRPNLSLIDNPGRLQSRAVNLAAASADPMKEVLVRCDAHAVYPPGFVLAVARSLYASGAASLAVPMDAVGDGATQRAVAFITDTKLGSGGAAHRGGVQSGWVDHGHHAGFRLDWFRKIGGYDEDYSHNEDAEYDRRLVQAGGKIWLDATIRLGVYSRPTFWGLARQYWFYGRGRARTLIKHRMRPRLRQVVPVLHTLALIVSIAALALVAAFSQADTSLMGLGLVYPFAYGGLLIGVSLWAARRIGMAGLRCGAALAVMHTAWGTGFLTQTLSAQ